LADPGSLGSVAGKPLLAHPDLLHAIIDESSVGLGLAGGDGSWVYTNPALCRLLGQAQGGMIGRKVEEFWQPGPAGEGEHCWRRPDGSTVWLRVGMRQLAPTASGLPGGTVYEVVDIERQKQAEATLAHSEQRANFALECARQWVWDLDFSANRVRRSPGWRTVFGLGDADLGGTDEAWQIVHPDDRAAIEAALQRVVTGLDEFFEATYRVQHKDGRWLWVLSRGKITARDPDGRPRHLLATSIDITAQKSLADQLADVNRRLEQQTRELRMMADAANQASLAKSEFLAAMSHDIRTPMSGVLGMADLLASERLTPSQQHYVETIRKSGVHLLSLLNDILDFSRIEAGRTELESVAFAPQQVLDQVHSLLAGQAIERGLSLRLENATSHSLVVKGDPNRLHQVVVNLVSNALKFTTRGEVVIALRELGATADDVQLRFEVTDTGVGIPEARQAALFQPFVQADRSTSRHYGGTGLGLAICKRLVEAMGGRIEIVSAEGQSSRFWFDLTLPRGDAIEMPDRRSAVEQLVRPLRILAADDVAANRELLAIVLERGGHKIDLAQDGAEALAAASRGGYDVLLMDVQMPLIDGVEATRRIRSMPPPAGEVPIFALTASAMANERARYLAAGMDGCVNKPIVWDELFTTLGDVAAGKYRRAAQRSRSSTLT
jgi:PAS domain S-box-containing protein